MKYKTIRNRNFDGLVSWSFLPRLLATVICAKFRGNVTPPGGEIQKRAPRRSWQGSISFKTSITFWLTLFSREEIALEDGHIFNFKRPVTLTLTSDDLESYIVRFVSSTSIQRYMVHMAPLQMSWTDGRTDGRTDVRTYGRTDIFPTNVIRLFSEGDNLKSKHIKKKIWNYRHNFSFVPIVTCWDRDVWKMPPPKQRRASMVGVSNRARRDRKRRRLASQSVTQLPALDTASTPQWIHRYENCFQRV